MKKEIPNEIELSIARCSGCNKRIYLHGSKGKCPHCKEEYFKHTDDVWYNEKSRYHIENKGKIK